MFSPIPTQKRRRAAVWSLLAILPFFPTQMWGQDQELRVLQREEIPYPSSPALSDQPKGRATVIVQIDREGNLVDALVSEYTRAAFAPAALEALESLTFEPGLRGGEPVGGRLPLEFNFEAGGGAIMQNSIEHIEEQLFGFQTTNLLAKARELDAPLKVISAERPMPAGITEPTEVVVDFYVDGEGVPRLAMARQGTHANAVAASVLAVRNWRFAPPRRNGHAVIVRVQQRFAFSPPEEAASTEESPPPEN